MTVERADWNEPAAEAAPAPAAPMPLPDAEEDEVLARSRQLLETGHFTPDEADVFLDRRRDGRGQQAKAESADARQR
jgi:hypothetical protein